MIMNNVNQHIPTGYKLSPLGIIPENWEVKRLGDLCFDIFSGSNKTRIDSGKYTVYGSTGIIGKTDEYKYEGERILVARVGAHAGQVSIASGKYDVSDNTIIVENQDCYSLYFAYQYLIASNLNKMVFGSGQPLITAGMLKRMFVVYPPFEEQLKINNVLQLWDTAIAKQTALIEKLTLLKRGLMQQLLTGKKRLKGFSGEWKTIELGDALSYIQPTKYLVVSENYNNTYNTPVLTAGKTFILGYTDETTGVFNDLPAIIFDDFTTESKYVTFPFKAKSSAMKILKANNSNLYFMFCAMQMIKYSIGGHERHWISKFSHLTLKVPSLDEQNAIATVLVQSDKEIEAQKQKLAAMQEQKKGVMQVLLNGKKRVK